MFRCVAVVRLETSGAHTMVMYIRDLHAQIILVILHDAKDLPLSPLITQLHELRKIALNAFAV